MKKILLFAIVSLLFINGASAVGLVVGAATPAQALNNAGYYASQLGDAAAAEHLFREALAHDASYELARYNLATLLFENGRHGDAIEELELLVVSSPGNARYHYDLAVNCIERFRWDGNDVDDFRCGLDHYEEASRLAPGIANVDENLAVLRSFLNN